MTTTAAATSPATAEDDDEDADETTPLIKKENKQLSPFRFTMAHLTCIGVGIVHLVWMAFGTALTIPMYFRYC